MADVIDVITRITYDVQDGELKDAAQSIQGQLQSVAILSNRLSKLQELLRNTSNEDIQKRQRITALINAQNKAIENTIANIGKEVQQNKVLQQAITNEIGLINTLTLKQKALTEERNKSNDVNKIRQYNKELESVNRQLGSLTNAGGGLSGQILSGLGIGAGFGIASLVSSGVGQIRQFISEASDLAAETEGVQRAFNRLNNPDLLQNLREATKGTVSDLELMKNAVQFSNFGLPVDKLATALSFARQRAADTGQSVDYLVQSIVTGIGRQSPLILDNLGINAKRVSDEFKRTGNFADAAFKIIQEEGMKATETVETFAEQQAKINASIQNAQAGFGKYFNEFKGFLFSLGKDIITGAALTENTFSDAYIKAQRAAREGNAQLQQIQTNANILYLQAFQQFQNQYEKADLGGRDKIKKQAQDMYTKLYNDGKTFYEKDLKQQVFYLRSLQQAYAQFNKRTAATQINLNTVTERDIASMSGEQLSGLSDQITNARAGLTAGDTKQIERYNKLSQVVKKYQNIINGSGGGGGLKKATEDWEEQQRRLNEALEKTYKLLGTPTQSELEAIEKQFKQINDEVNRLVGSLSESFRTQLQQLYTPAVTPETRAKAAQLEAQQAKRASLDNQKLRNENDRAARKADAERAKQQMEHYRGLYQQQKELDPNSPQSKAAKEDYRNARQKYRELRYIANEETRAAIDEAAQGYQYLAATAASALDEIYQKQIEGIERQIAATQERISVAVELAKLGNAQILQEEQNRLDELQKKREEVAEKQLRTNALLRASSSAIALAQAVQTVTNAGATGDPYTTAARIAAAVAALAAGISFATSITEAFAEGVVDYNGKGTGTSDSNLVRISRGESVITADATQRFKPILEAMNNGTFNPYTAMPMQQGNSKVEMKVLEGKMNELIEAYHSTGTTVKTRVDESGVHQIIERQRRLNQSRFR